MKKHLFILLLVCLLLCGCAAQPEATEDTTLPAVSETEATEPNGFYDPGSALEAATGGAVRCYPLGTSDSVSVMALGEDLLLFSSTESGTMLTVLTGDTLYPTAHLETAALLSAADFHLRPWDSGISFFDTQSLQTVVLDAGLREVARIAAPEDLKGVPLLSSDRSTLYYCTRDAIRALDLETGISRCLKEISYPIQNVTGLWMEDTVLECSISDNETARETLFLSTETGELLEVASDDLVLSTSDNRYYATFRNGSTQSYVFGTGEDTPQALNPAGSGDCLFLPEDNAAVMIRQPEDSVTILEYYDLESGRLASSLTLETDSCPWSFESFGDGRVCFLNYEESYGCSTLYVWDTAVLPSGAETVYTGIYYSLDTPDYEGLAGCTLYAEELSEKYGIEVLIYKKAAAVQPWDYDLEYEYLTPVIRQELEQLDSRLANYPEGFLQTLAQRFDGLSICIVRSISGSAESGSLESANGVQFWDDYHAYLALAAGQETEHALYHELCHLIDTIVLNESSAYDRWDELNPTGFAYDFDYVANQNRNSGEYLREESRYFIDMYSMSFPKEDRARIMEYAMTDGNASYFQSTTMQAKLKLLCQGIREAFGLRKSPETFLWEQYLNESLAYTG